MEPPPRDHPRIAALDLARALAVVLMVVGHTLDAVLSPAARTDPPVALYWSARGVTAPLFLIVSGWALAAATQGRAVRGFGVLRGRLPRVLLLLALGYALRWPGWGIALLGQGDPSAWAHLLAFDALHAIAASLLATSLLLGLPAGVGWKAGALAALALLAVALGASPPFPATALPRSIPALAVAQAVGGTSPFPLFPWSGYFFAGAAIGLLGAQGDRRFALALGLGGALLVAAGGWNGVEGMPGGDPRLFAFRTGASLVLLASLWMVPSAMARLARPIARASLAAYAIHLPLVYGWSTHQGLQQRIGPQLPLGAALEVALAVVLATLVASPAVTGGVALLRRAVERARAPGARSSLRASQDLSSALGAGTLARASAQPSTKSPGRAPPARR
ncbi:MAG TPA: acyltransferase family protein [Anaeromyxobacteraceae bacterium]|nr:acyltransferase family protein [Anaeromyxobacteraceae bacterium]